jgi:UDP:flavonoid glycosyltransferase YjiC (YdhE family)
LVLLSFSTVSEQKSVAKLQMTLDGLASLPVHVVATTGGDVSPSELSAPANARVVAFADHNALLDRAAVVVGHGGHGTTMRSLSKGVPIVCIPAPSVDQGPNAEMVQAWGAGIALPTDANSSQVHAAVQAVLADPGYAAQAQRLATEFSGLNGAQLAADSLEALLT